MASPARNAYDEKLGAGTDVFSTRRPNAIRHTPAAVRDTVQERQPIQQAYPVTAPIISPKKPAHGKSSGGRGSHRRSSQPTNADSPDLPAIPASGG